MITGLDSTVCKHNLFLSNSQLMSSYAPLSHWTSQTNPAQKESWYNMPGTSPYELNTHVSTPQGPTFGPKASLFSKHTLSTKQGVFAGIGIIALVCLVALLMRQRTKNSIPTFYF
jgi:hypothetical protein